VRRREPRTSRFLAGGVDLVLYAPPDVTTLIDLSRLGIDDVRREGDDVLIGAMATITQVLESAIVEDVARGFLPSVLRQVASPLQRNVATIGGAAVRAHPWSDVVTALLVLDAQLEVFDGGRRRIDLADARGRNDEPFPLVLALRLPGERRGARAAFEKFSLTGFDVATLNCACAVRVERGICRDVRVAIGGAPSVAHRLPRAEQALSGKSLTEVNMAATAREAAGEIDARDDRRASAAYRRRLADVGVRRCLAALAAETERETR
jgi:CO/xanthine dehydrogenase FAD-binding subunit